jgi:mono/diheme cytochrome c family protein
MSRTLVQTLLVLVLVLLIAAHWAVPSDPTQRNFHFLPGMVDSVAHEAQAPVPQVGGDLIVDLRPPEGSVARGYEPLPYEPGPEGAALAGAELQNPIAVDDPSAAARGAFVFSTFCVTCHGPQGLGDGTVAKLGVPPPPSLAGEKAVQMADGQMYHIITLGQGNMAAYAAQVEREDRWRVINYVRQLQQQAATE